MLGWIRKVWSELQRRRRLPPKPIRVLRLLVAEGAPIQGWRLIERAELRLGFASGYTTIREMVEAGLLACEVRRAVLDQRGGRPAFYYAVTDAGRAHLVAEDRRVEATA